MRDILISIFPMFVCLFWTVFLLTDYIETHNRSKGRLALFMLVATFLYSGHFVFFQHRIDLLPLSDTVYVFSNLSVYPLYYLYIRELTVSHSQRSWGYWLLTLPPVLIAVAVMFVYMKMSPEEFLQFTEHYLYHNTFTSLTGLAYVQAVIHHLGKFVFALQIIPILYFGNRHIHRFEHLIQTVYSNQEGKSLRPVQFLLILFAITSLFSFLSNIVGRHQFIEHPGLLSIPSLLFSFFLYFIGYVGYRQSFTIRELEAEIPHDGSPETDPSDVAESQGQQRQEPAAEDVAAAADAQSPEVTADVSLPLQQRIDALVRGQKLYLRPNLKISDLTNLLGSNRNYIYNAINVEMGISFSDYINRMRVEHAQQLMRQRPGILLSEAALKSGFSSTVSFYRAFKKFVGCAPKEWQPESVQI